MDQKVVNRERLKLKDKDILSPPVVSEPLYQCATAVTVTGMVPHAQVILEVNATTLPAVTSGPTGGLNVQLPSALIAGDKVRARQQTATAISGWSAPPVTVRDHTPDFPAGPPRPEIKPLPLFKCGVETAVANLLIGGNMWVTADGVEVGRENGCGAYQAVRINPPFGLGQKVRAWFEMCKDPSPPSVEQITQSPPALLPAPTFDTIYTGATVVVVRNIANGATITLLRNGANQGTFSSSGGAQAIGCSAVAAGETFSATQQLCPGDPPSPPGGGTVQPCSALPAPQIGPVQGGDTIITITSSVPSATIRVFINGTIAGVGGAPVIPISPAVKIGDTIHVVQDLVGCKGQWASEVKVPCVDPPVAVNPAWLDLFPIGSFDYDDGAGRLGNVFYPAEDDGAKQPFNKRLAKLGPAPIVFLLHGRHNPADPSFLGYDYFQQDLAKMGIIAVSINSNALNGNAHGVANIEDRAHLLIDTIALFQSFNGDASHRLFERIDFNRTGLMGHSRGGDAVVTVPTLISLAGVTIKSVLALAPTNFRFWGGMSTIQPKNHAFMTILPAGDGDVDQNNGAQFYDQAVTGPFKSQVYVHFTNHNFFNRQWLYDDSANYTQPAVMARVEHEHVLSAYGCALYRASLLGHNTLGYLFNRQLPAGVVTQNVHLSFARDKVTTVDHYEDKNTIAKNSLGRPNTQLSGMSADEFVFQQDPGAFGVGAGAAGSFNDSFYGQTTGMVARAGRAGRMFRWEVAKDTSMKNAEIWIRAAEVTDGANVPSGSTGFMLGLEDMNGVRAWLDTNVVGGLPRPYARNSGMIKTMLKTLRFRAACFGAPKFKGDTIQAILIKCDRKDERNFAFDDLQIVT